MRLVVDTNVVFAAMLREGTTRRLFAHPALSLAAPGSLASEIEVHWPELAERASGSEEDLRLVWAQLRGAIREFPLGAFLHDLTTAERVLAGIDAEDAPLLALAHALGCPLWTQDKRLRRQSWVEVLDTADLLDRLA